jgi:hypothetical protein
MARAQRLRGAGAERSGTRSEESLGGVFANAVLFHVPSQVLPQVPGQVGWNGKRVAQRLIGHRGGRMPLVPGPGVDALELGQRPMGAGRLLECCAYTTVSYGRCHAGALPSCFLRLPAEECTMTPWDRGPKGKPYPIQSIRVLVSASSPPLSTKALIRRQDGHVHLRAF